jgi:hypothetical protein
MKHFMRGMEKDFIPVLKEYIDMVLDGYRVIPISSYIYSLEVIASVYNDETTKPLVKYMFKEIVELTFKNYLVSEEDFENVQLTEDFFGLLYRLMKLNPFLVFDSELFEKIVIFCINKMDIHHLDSSKNILYFLEKVFNIQDLSRFKGMDNEVLRLFYNKVKSCMDTFGELMVSKIIAFIIDVPATMIFDHLKELICCLAMNFQNETAFWFEKLLKSVFHMIALQIQRRIRCYRIY